MKYAIEQSFARYENGNLLECRFVVKNKQGKVLYRCNNLISAQKEVERLLKEQKCKSKNNEIKEFKEFIKNKRVKNEQNLSQI